MIEIKKTNKNAQIGMVFGICLGAAIGDITGMGIPMGMLFGMTIGLLLGILKDQKVNNQIVPEGELYFF